MINEFRNQHDYLSNFYQSPVEYEGLMYTSVEAAFQAATDRTGFKVIIDPSG